MTRRLAHVFAARLVVSSPRQMATAMITHKPVVGDLTGVPLPGHLIGGRNAGANL